MSLNRVGDGAIPSTNIPISKAVTQEQTITAIEMLANAILETQDRLAAMEGSMPLPTVEATTEAEPLSSLEGDVIQEAVESLPSSHATLLTSQVAPECHPTTGLLRPSPEREGVATIKIFASSSGNLLRDDIGKEASKDTITEEIRVSIQETFIIMLYPHQ